MGFFITFFSSAQEIKDFSLPNIADGKNVSLEYFKEKAGVILIFFNHECPYNTYYLERIKKISVDFQEVPLLLIHTGSAPPDSPNSMKEFYRQQNLKVPYLSDKTGVAMEMFNAKKTPEVFLIKIKSGAYHIFFHGSIDDNPQVEDDVQKYYLKDALTAMLKGTEPTIKETRPIGCALQKP